MADTHDSSPLSLRALQIARYAEHRGIRGGLPGWGKFRGPDVDGYQREVGLALSENIADEGHPWCASAQYAIHKQAEGSGQASECPRTGSALHLAAAAPAHCKLEAPRPGAVFVLEHADHVHGHCGIVETAWPDGSVTSVEGDTSGAGSSTGDSWGRHTWNPADGRRGKLAGWFDFGVQGPADVLVASVGATPDAPASP